MLNLKKYFVALVAFAAVLSGCAQNGARVETLPSPQISTQTQSAAVQNDASKRTYRKIFIVRHGHRPPLSDPPLTAIGLKQAERAALRLKEMGFDGEIYASPFVRTIETAVPSARLFGKKIRICPFMQETSSDDPKKAHKGYTQAQLSQIFPELISPTPALEYPWVKAGNNGKNLKKRIADGFENLLKNTSGDIAIFTHQGPLIAASKYLGEKAGVKVGHPGWNCTISYFTVNENGEIGFVGISTDFMPPEEITNNNGKNVLGVRVPTVIPPDAPSLEHPMSR